MALSVHGFVLAGGNSSRMGQDKALLCFQGRPMIEIALEKLRGFCRTVSISGNRDDLASLSEVISEDRLEVGPAAGVESGLRATSQTWAMFLPVDVPLIPGALLKHWASVVLAEEPAGVRLSFLRANGVNQPAICLLHRDCRAPWEAAIEDGERKLGSLFVRVAAALGPDSMLVLDAERFAPPGHDLNLEVEAWFSNVNTPEDLSSLERRVGESVPKE